MSIKIMARVWELSKQKGTDLLLLLALADNSDDSGYCWPGIEYLADKIRMTPRSVINAVQRLEKSGEIIVNHNRRTGNRYLIAVGMDAKELEKGALKLGCENFSDSAENVAVFTSEVKNIHIRSETAISQEPSRTVKEPSIGNHHFVALAKVCQIDLGLASKTQKQQLGQSAKLLHEKAEATPEQIDNFGTWWFSEDWRGKKGQPPTPVQVRESWGMFKKSTHYTNGGALKVYLTQGG